jgi:hypothetical protein
MALYKLGKPTFAVRTLVLGKFHYAPVPPDEPVPPILVHIPFEPMQCCIQDFSDMTIGDGSTVAVGRITQDCQLVINGLPTGPATGDTGTTDTGEEDPADGLSPVAIGLLATIGGLLFVVALYFFLQWVNNDDNA